LDLSVKVEAATTMADTDMNDIAAGISLSEPTSYSTIPPVAKRRFGLCWQLENWLRIIVYVELRAA